MLKIFYRLDNLYKFLIFIIGNKNLTLLIVKVYSLYYKIKIYKINIETKI